MKKSNVFLASFVAVTALTAYTLSAATSSTHKVQQGEGSGISLKLSYKLEKHYGIRPDVGKYILEEYPRPLEAAAATQLAKTVQLALIIDAADPKSTQMVVDKMTRAIRCATKTFNSDKKILKLLTGVKTATVNTPLRVEAYGEFGKVMSESSVSIPKDSSVCDAKVLG